MTKNQFWKGSTFFVLFSFDLTQVYNFIRQVWLMLQNSYCGNIIYFLCQNFNRTTSSIYQTRLYKLQTRIIYFQTPINYIMGSQGVEGASRGSHGAIGLVWWVSWWFMRHILTINWNAELFLPLFRSARTSCTSSGQPVCLSVRNENLDPMYTSGNTRSPSGPKKRQNQFCISVNS